VGERVEHDGVVTRVTGQSVTVTIECQTACEECRAREACGITGGGTREIVVLHPGVEVAVGQRVTVRVGSGNAARSALLAYVLPSVLLVAMVAILSPRLGEVMVAVIALLSVAAYFFLIFLCRNALARTIKFTITPRR
jgi:sigma-E factor negative regulatory protein RseC